MNENIATASVALFLLIIISAYILFVDYRKEKQQYTKTKTLQSKKKNAKSKKKSLSDN